MKIIYCGISGKEKLISLDDVKECEERRKSVEKAMTIVNVNIKMFKKWKIKMYSFPTFIPQLVPLYRLAFL